MSLRRIRPRAVALAGRVLVTSCFVLIASCSGGRHGNVTPTLQSLEVSPTNPSVAAGVSEQFSATGIYSDASHQDLTMQVSWSSSSATVAAIASDGMAKALTGGTTTITATMSGASGSSQFTVTPAVLKQIQVTPTNPNLPRGASVQLTATGLYSDNSTADLTAQVSWSSSSNAVATVSATGVSTALTVGTATITATSGVVAGTTAIQVTNATLKAIEVTPQGRTIPQNFTLQFTATGVYTDDSTHNITSQVTWSSSKAAVASVSASGLATAIAAGTTVISASLGNTASGADSATLTVSTVALTSVTITPTAPNVPLGTTQQLTATGNLSDTSTMDLSTLVTWASSKNTVATVSNASGSNGLATPVALGVTNITAAFGPITSAPDPLTVTPAALVSIAVTPANASIALGTSEQFVAIGTYSDQSTRPLTTQVTWSSSNTGTASISNAASSQGLATSRSVGATTISATIGTVTGTSALNVTGAVLASIAVTPPDIWVLSGGAEQFVATGTYSDSSTQNLTTAVRWSSSAVSVATISNASGSQGLATLLSYGNSTITAMLNGISGSASLNVISELAYVPNFNDGTVSMYSIPDTGAPAANGSPSTIAAGNQPYSVAVAQPGRYAYVSNEADGTLSQYSINADGTLSALTPSTVATGTSPRRVIVDPTGSYVYVTNSGDNTVSGYSIGADGRLTAVSGSNVGTGAAPVAVIIDPSGQYAYVVGNSCNCVSQYTVGAGGSFSPMTPAAIATGNSPTDIVVAPNGQFVYVVNSADNTVSVFTIGAGGALQATGTTPTGNDPQTMAISPYGSYAYVANAADNDIGQYALGNDGSLTPLAKPVIAVGTEPLAVSFDHSGFFVYVVNAGDSDVTSYSVGGDGTLTPLAQSPIGTGSSPMGITTSWK